MFVVCLRKERCGRKVKVGGGEMGFVYSAADDFRFRISSIDDERLLSLDGPLGGTHYCGFMSAFAI